MFDRFKPAALGDNAMLYKDLTQWLRNKTFVGLFFGLLLMAEGVSVYVTSMPSEPGRTGPVVFNILVVLLYLYGLVIGFIGYTLTSREFQNRTFELYELSGMSLEKMIRGKWGSMIAQFLFGFFCIVPFLFFSYLLGGLDFYTVLGVVVLAAILVPPFYLIVLAVALHGQKIKALSTLFRVGAGLAFIWVGWVVLVSIIDGLHRRSTPMADVGRLIKEILTTTGSHDALIWCSVFLTFHLLFCLILFYLSCNAISPVTDSREGAVKGLSALFCLGLMALGPVGFWVTKSAQFFVFLVPVFGIECLLGLLYFWGPVEVPLMARRRQEESRWRVVRLVRYWFQAGAGGTFRTLLLLWGVAKVLQIWINSWWMSAHPYQENSNQFASLLLAVPFWITLPGLLLLGFRRFRQSPVLMRMTLLMWWGVGGAVFFVILVVLQDVYRYRPDSPFFYYLSGVLTPVSAFSVLLMSSSGRFAGLADTLCELWRWMGLLGLLALARILYGRIRLDREDRQAALQAVEAAEVVPQHSAVPPESALPPLSAEGCE
jgi:hypothetical protein